jgi:hypothetical protein
MPDSTNLPDNDPPAITETKGERAAHWPFFPRFLLLNVGLLLYGIALAAMIRADVGLAPWDALHRGLALVMPGLKIGQASILVGVVCQGVAYAALKMPVGLGSVFNMVFIGLYIDAFMPLLPHPATPLIAWVLFLLGILFTGIATGTYIASRFGAGPRDSLVIGINRRTHWPVKYIRSVIELAVLCIGFLLGAKVGLGTLVFALLVGPAMSLGMGLYGLKR